MKTTEQTPYLRRPSMEKKFSSWGFLGHLALLATDRGDPTWLLADTYVPGLRAPEADLRGGVPRELARLWWEAGEAAWPQVSPTSLWSTQLLLF